MPMLAPTCSEICSSPNGGRERLDQAPDQVLGDRGVGEAGAEDRELVAAEPGHGVALADHRPEPRGDQPEQLVTHVVPEGVVDLLEVVEVQQQQRDLLPVAGQVRVPAPAQHQQGPVGQSGQGVVHGLDVAGGGRAGGLAHRDDRQQAQRCGEQGELQRQHHDRRDAQQHGGHRDLVAEVADDRGQQPLSRWPARARRTRGSRSPGSTRPLRAGTEQAWSVVQLLRVAAERLVGDGGVDDPGAGHRAAGTG